MRTFNIFGYQIVIQKNQKILMNGVFDYIPYDPIKLNYWQKLYLTKRARFYFATVDLERSMIERFFRVKILLIKECRQLYGWSLGQAKDVVEFLIGKNSDERKF